MKPAPGQQSLFGSSRTAHEEHDEPRVKLNATVKPKDEKRLDAACRRIWARFKEGPATNRELLDIGGIRYSARIGELRKAGVDIQTDDHAAGSIHTYRLIE